MHSSALEEFKTIINYMHEDQDMTILPVSKNLVELSKNGGKTLKNFNTQFKPEPSGFDHLNDCKKNKDHKNRKNNNDNNDGKDENKEHDDVDDDVLALLASFEN